MHIVSFWTKHNKALRVGMSRKRGPVMPLGMSESRHVLGGLLPWHAIRLTPPCNPLGSRATNCEPLAIVMSGRKGIPSLSLEHFKLLNQFGLSCFTACKQDPPVLFDELWHIFKILWAMMSRDTSWPAIRTEWTRSSHSTSDPTADFNAWREANAKREHPKYVTWI